jgi:hypothetical protein
LLSATPIAVPASGYTPEAPLTDNTVHYWEVRAVDALGTIGSWSATYSLHVSWGTSGPADGIRFVSELQLLAGAAYRGGTCELGADLDIGGIADWTPIGPFTGSFDGKGHTISGMRPVGLSSSEDRGEGDRG